jgi:hypothetical protein
MPRSELSWLSIAGQPPVLEDRAHVVLARAVGRERRGQRRGSRGAGARPSPSIARIAGSTKITPQTMAETGFPGSPIITMPPPCPAISGFPGRIATL